MSFNPSTFLANYWQQQPLVIRNLFPASIAPLDEHDLAGLAQEPDIDSRIVQFHNKQWDVFHGPFKDFSTPCQGQWSLLVQAVDRYIPEANALFAPFRFLPDWRIDDLMVSFAVAGAGVGPHLDQYDVFLVQGKGRRRWRVGKPGTFEQVLPHPHLCQIAGFESEIDVELHPGDVLYIPPGWPHEGIALEDCITYSVGFRAPDTASLSHCLAEYMTTVPASERFCDPGRHPVRQSGYVSGAELSALKAMLHNAIDSDGFDSALMRMLSEQALPEWPQETLTNATEVQHLLAEGAHLVLCPGCRPLYLNALDTTAVTLFIDGEEIPLPSGSRELADALLTGTIAADSLPCPAPLAICETLATLINKGYLQVKQ